MQIRFEEIQQRITNMWNSLPDSVVLADTVNQFKNRLDKHWANYAFLYDYLVKYNGTGSLFVVQKNCENLDVDLEAIACVHSLQYSTVQYSMLMQMLEMTIYQLAFRNGQASKFRSIFMIVTLVTLRSKRSAIEIVFRPSVCLSVRASAVSKQRAYTPPDRPGVSLGYEKKTAKIFATAFLQRVVYCPRMDVGI